MPSPPILIADKYALQEKLGEGGMGEVWVAVNTHLQKRVALKVMGKAVATNADFVERFLREAVIASRVRHPAIVEIFDAGRHEGTPWIAMELLEGESLGKRLERGPISVDELFPIVLPILDALHALHEAGVVHRDIKPDNIFIERRSNGTTQPKLLDFGIAKRADAHRLTETGTVIGTAWYLSPEQAKNSSTVDRRSDIYAMGVVLFECLSGAMPYEAESVTELIAKLFTEHPRDLGALAPHVPPHVVQLVARCLARDAADRPATAHALATELLDATSARPLSHVDATSATMVARAGTVQAAPVALPRSAAHARAASAVRTPLPSWLRWLIGAGATALVLMTCVPCVFMTYSCSRIASGVSRGVGGGGQNAIFLTEVDVNHAGRMDFTAMRTRVIGYEPSIYVEAIDGDTFEPLWASRGLGSAVSGFAETFDEGRYIALVSDQGFLWVVETASGNVLSETALSDRFESLCRFADGRLAVRTADETLTVLDALHLQHIALDEACIDQRDARASFSDGASPLTTHEGLPEPEGMRVVAAYDAAPNLVIVAGTRMPPATAVPMIGVVQNNAPLWMVDAPSADPMHARHGAPSPILARGETVLAFYGTPRARMMTAFELNSGRRLFDTALADSNFAMNTVVLGTNDIFVQRVFSLEIYDARTGELRRRIYRD